VSPRAGTRITVRYFPSSGQPIPGLLFS